jgi:hypothetical protein
MEGSSDVESTLPQYTSLCRGDGQTFTTYDFKMTFLIHCNCGSELSVSITGPYLYSLLPENTARPVLFILHALYIRDVDVPFHGFTDSHARFCKFRKMNTSCMHSRNAVPFVVIPHRRRRPNCATNS